MDIMQTLSNIGIIPVIVLDDPNKAVPLAKALVEGGIPCAEVTFRTAAGEEAIKKMAKECPEILVGAGTVLNVDMAKRAVAAGAKFIVSPGLNEDVVKWCIENGVPCTPGCANPSEMTRAYNLGLKVVKFFPAENLGGISFIKACGAALPLKFIPTGGVNTKNLPEYASSDKIFACGGTWMVKKDMVEAEKWDEIIKICKDAVRVLLGFSIAHVGINLSDNSESEKMTKQIASAFDLPLVEKTSSNFAGTLVECMNAKGRGTNGHVAIATNNIDRAVYHMTRWGVEFDESSRNIDKKTGKTKAIYLKNEMAGFAFHLVQK